MRRPSTSSEAVSVPVKKRCRHTSQTLEGGACLENGNLPAGHDDWKMEDVLKYIRKQAHIDATKLENDMRLLQGLAEERKNWYANAPILYNCFISCELQWPALSVAWLPDVSGESCKLVVGTHTDGSAPAEVAVMEMHCQLEERDLSLDEWQAMAIPNLGETQCLGIQPTRGQHLLRHVARWQHPTEVNRLAPCPYRPQLLATKAANGDVMLYDYKACPQRPQQRCRSKSSAWPLRAENMPPQMVLSFPTKVDGWALAWGPMHGRIVASGGDDGHLCAWDTSGANSGAGRGCTPFVSYIAHEGACGDISFAQAGELATVGGDDGHLKLWDLRMYKSPSLSKKISDGDLRSVDWSPHREHILATAGAPHDVLVWDIRALSAPLCALAGHTEEVVVVRWAPTREDLLCSAARDNTVILWDLQAEAAASTPADDAQQEDGEQDDASKELLFMHNGHTEGVSDVAWNSQDQFLLCSVADDNRLQIWQPSSMVTAADRTEE